MSSLPESPIFILEGHDLGVFDSIEGAESQLEPIDVTHEVYPAYDGHGRRLRLSTDGRSIVIQLAEEEPRDWSSLETELRAHLLRLGESRAAEATCALPCLIEMSGRHSELDQRFVARAAHEVEERYRPDFQNRGGRLSVHTGKASNFKTRTKSMELTAGVEWDASRVYDHAHVEVARRRWFSWRWDRVRSSREAIDEIDARLAEWLRLDS